MKDTNVQWRKEDYFWYFRTSIQNQVEKDFSNNLIVNSIYLLLFLYSFSRLDDDATENVFLVDWSDIFYFQLKLNDYPTYHLQNMDVILYLRILYVLLVPLLLRISSFKPFLIKVFNVKNIYKRNVKEFIISKVLTS